MRKRDIDMKMENVTNEVGFGVIHEKPYYVKSEARANEFFQRFKRLFVI